MSDEHKPFEVWVALVARRKRDPRFHTEFHSRVASVKTFGEAEKIIDRIRVLDDDEDLRKGHEYEGTEFADDDDSVLDIAMRGYPSWRDKASASVRSTCRPLGAMLPLDCLPKRLRAASGFRVVCNHPHICAQGDLTALHVVVLFTARSIHVLLNPPGGTV